MKWITLTAALMVFGLSTGSADAGLFGCHKKSNCCPPAPCCEAAPVYHAPAPCCEPAPCYDACCAPKKKCGLFGGGLFSCFHKKHNNCCAPAPCCEQAPVYHAPAPCCEQAPIYDNCCAPKKKCGLFGGLFSCFHKKHRNNCCGPVHYAPAPACSTCGH